MRTTGPLPRWVLLCLLPLLAVAAKAESVGVVLTAAGLADANGTALPDNRLIQVIANTGGQTPAAPTATAFTSGSDVVLASFGLNSATTGIPGSFQAYLTIDRSAFPGLASGTTLYLRWYDIPYVAGQTAPGTAHYGQFTTNAVADGSTSGWTLAADGHNASLQFITATYGGSQSDAAGRATLDAVSLPPTITIINPTAGPVVGGTAVTITGTDLSGATAVKFGANPATSYTVTSPTSITATAPAGSAGTVDVTVTTAGGTSVTGAADQYTYVAAPTVTAVSTLAGPLGGGTTVTITGTNLSGATAVTFGTTPARSYTVTSATSITATTPAGSAGTVDVTVTTAGGISATGAANQYTFVSAPVITSSLKAEGTYGVPMTPYTIKASSSPFSYAATNLPAWMSFDPSTGELSGTPTSVAGSPFRVTISATNDGGVGSATLVFTVNPKSVIGTFTAQAKVYDGTTAATVQTRSLSGVLGTDSVSLSGGTAAFATPAVGTSRTVTLTGATLTGAHSENYRLASVDTTTASITPKAVTITGVGALSKVYDGSVAATPVFTGATLVGIVPSDASNLTLVSADATATFASRHAGTGKSVTLSGLTLGGAAAANYTLVQPTTTATISAKRLEVTGTVVATRVYDGSVSAPVNFDGASLAGVAGAEAVTLVTRGATASYGDANAGSGKPVTVTGLALAGADAGNYTLGQPAGVTGTIARADVSFTVSQLKQVYDGKGKAPTVVAQPNAPFLVSYSSIASTPTTKLPIEAGIYTAIASTTDDNFAGTKTFTFEITPAAQALTIKAPASGLAGTTADISATSDSGLPVALAVTSGNATLANGVLAFSAPGPVTLRATQAGNGNYAPASAEVTIAVSGKKSQVITFPALADRLRNSGPLTLAATASSGLPVSYAVQSGPAMLVGNQITLTGSTGRVVVVASQGGDAAWNPAPEVVQTFTVTAAGVNVFFGTVTSAGTTTVGDIAAALTPNGNTGSLVVVAPSLNLQCAVDFTVEADGRFTQTFVIDGATGTSAKGEPIRAAASVTFTLRGQVIGGRLSGTIEPLGVSFDAPALPVAGSSANSAGFYKAPAIGTSVGTTYSVIGTNNEVLALSTSGTVTVGGVTRLAADGTFAIQSTTTSGTVTLKGAVDETSTTVSGTLTIGNQTTSFGGLSSAVTRTDRMINLSSRANLSGPASVLITGFVIRGAEAKQVAIRAIGPALSSYGVTNAMVDPLVRLYSDGRIVAENDTWNAVDAATFARLGAFALPAGSKDAAVIVTLKPGAYTAHVTGTAAGVVLAEIYDASVNPNADDQRLVNISSRSEVTAGDGALIGGFVVTGNSPKQLLIRGVGPALASLGLTGVLADPRLRLYRDGAVVAENDNWSAVRTDAAAIAEAARQVGAFPLTSGSKDAAVIVTLNPGAYTAQVFSNDGGRGTALVEIYELP